jgi:hypothetical protein
MSKNEDQVEYRNMCYIRNEKCVSHRGLIHSTIMLCDSVKARYAGTYSTEGPGVHAISYTQEHVKKIQYLMMHTFDHVDRYSSLCRNCYMRTYGNPAESSYVNYRTNMDSWMLPRTTA